MPAWQKLAVKAASPVHSSFAIEFGHTLGGARAAIAGVAD
jgi:hypothetical protein